MKNVNKNKKQFMELLKSYEMENEEKMFALLNQYLDKMDEHMNTLTQELVSVKQELSSIQENNSKSKLSKATDNFENTIKDTKQKVESIKSDINIAVHSGIEQSQLYGKESLMNAISSLHIEDTMKGLRSLNERIIDRCDKLIDVLTNITNESHKALEHSKNAFKSIAGKETEAPGDHNFDKGIVAGIQKMLFKIMEKATDFNKKIDNSITQLNQHQEKIDVDREANKSIKQRIENAKKQQKMQEEKSKDIPEQEVQFGKKLDPSR